MRIWLDPDKLRKYSLMPSDVNTALHRRRTPRCRPASWRALPAASQPAAQRHHHRAQQAAHRRAVPQRGAARTQPTARWCGWATSPASSSAAESLTPRSVASAASPASGMGIELATGANAVHGGRDAVNAKIAELRALLPEPARRPWSATTPRPSCSISIEEVVKTLGEAMVLVVLVMYLFLQNLRATLIPAIAVPVVLLGTFGVLGAAGLLDQHADHVRHGAGHRPAGGRRHRGGRERRAR